jgi:uncharacterized membrane protein
VPNLVPWRKGAFARCMASDVESGLQTSITKRKFRRAIESSSKPSFRSQHLRGFSGLDYLAFWVCLISCSCTNVLGVHLKKYHTWHVYFVVYVQFPGKFHVLYNYLSFRSLCAWCTVITISIVTLCVLQSSIIR